MEGPMRQQNGAGILTAQQAVALTHFRSAAKLGTSNLFSIDLRGILVDREESTFFPRHCSAHRISVTWISGLLAEI
jgi:hypothetical protein